MYKFDIIDRTTLKHIQEIEDNLIAFRGVRQLWANVVAGGVLTCFHAFSPRQEEKENIANDLYEEQLARLSQLTTHAQKLQEYLKQQRERCGHD
jgi:hypothetical protein